MWRVWKVCVLLHPMYSCWAEVCVDTRAVECRQRRDNTVLRCDVVRCIVLCFIALHCIALHCIDFKCFKTGE
jgi:hypothetical protein